MSKIAVEKFAVEKVLRPFQLVRNLSSAIMYVNLSAASSDARILATGKRQKEFFLVAHDLTRKRKIIINFTIYKKMNSFIECEIIIFGFSQLRSARDDFNLQHLIATFRGIY